MKAFKDSSAGLNDNPDEDTVELELGPEYLRALSQAAESSAESATPVERTPIARSHLPPAPRETARATDLWVSLSIAAVLGMTAVAIALWPADQGAQIAAQSVAPAISTKAPVPETPTRTAPSAAPLQFANPFDASEVFEFPPGTSVDAARESVAEVLLERARERRTQIDDLRQVHSHRSASFAARSFASHRVTLRPATDSGTIFR
jgi:hypothetical protein